MIADNIVHFARVLRNAGMAIGPDRVLAALAAVEAVGLQRRALGELLGPFVFGRGHAFEVGLLQEIGRASCRERVCMLV